MSFSNMKTTTVMVHGMILNLSKTHPRRSRSDSAYLSVLSSSPSPNWLDLLHVIRGLEL